MPTTTEIKTRLIGRPTIDGSAMRKYLESVGGTQWLNQVFGVMMDDAEVLVEFCGRLCYKSWTEGLNPNVTRVRKDSAAYLLNILASGHGSVLEHAMFNFVVENGTRVFTHEGVRHRAGTAFCLDGDTEVTIQTDGNGRDRVTLQRVKIKDLYARWHDPKPDSMGRKRPLPASRNRTLRVLNEQTQTFQMARMLNIWQTGLKDTVEIVTANGQRLVCTPEHAIYTEYGWVKAGDLIIGDKVAVTGKRNIAPPTHGFTPRLRSAIAVWTTQQRDRLIKPVDQCSVCEQWFDAAQLELDHVVPVVEDLARALDITNLRPICGACHVDKTATEQPPRQLVAGSKFVAVRSIEPAGERMTYDLEVEGPWNNYLANGIVVHNSQESMRYVRLTDIPFWFPEWALADTELMGRSFALLEQMEDHQIWMGEHFGLDDDGVAFSEKKHKTSFMRRFAPQGVSTHIVLSANIRAIRHILEMRTDDSAEEEIRLIANQIGDIMIEEVPLLFGDYTKSATGALSTPYRKV